MISDTPMLDDDAQPFTWVDLAAEQDQVLALWQALALGLTKAAWDWRLSQRRWTTLIPGVAVLHSGIPSQQQWLWAAVLHGGSGAALSGDAGLVAHRITMPVLTQIDVAVPWPRAATSFTPPAGPVIVCHGVRGLEQWVHVAREPAVLNLVPALLHAASWAKTDRDAEWRVAAVVQQRRATPAWIREGLGSMPRMRRRGLIREVLDDVEFGAHAASELMFLRFCRKHGLPEPDEMQVRVRANGTKYLDARYRRQRVSVELDGAHHRLVKQWEADLLRSLQLAVAAHGTGETQIRLSPGTMRHDGEEVAQLLRALLV